MRFTDHEVRDRHDVLVIDLGDTSGLLKETAHLRGVLRQLRMQHLDRDPSAEEQVLRQKDLSA